MSFSNGDINKGSLRGTTLLREDFKGTPASLGHSGQNFYLTRRIYGLPHPHSGADHSDNILLSLFKLMGFEHVWVPKSVDDVSCSCGSWGDKGIHSLLRVKHFYHQNVACFCRTVLLLSFVCLSFLLFSFFLLCFLKVTWERPGSLLNSGLFHLCGAYPHNQPVSKIIDFSNRP